MVICAMTKEELEKNQKYLERLKKFTLMDDDFMTRFFEDDIECIQFVIRTILGNKKITVVKEWEPD